MHKIAVAGFRHPHILSLFQDIAATPECRIVGCCEEDAATRAGLAERPECKIDHTDYAAMLRDLDCDIVALGDYYAKRGAMAIAALKAGKHVIADKPLCTSLDELAEIRRLAGENKRCVGLMLPLWSHGNAVAARDLIATGKIGEVQAVAFTGQHPLNYGTRPGWYFEPGKHGGTINDIAPHGIDLTQFITGMKFSAVAAVRTWNGQFPEAPHFHNGAQFLAVLENGAGITADVSYFACHFGLPGYWRFSVWGTRGWLEFNFKTPGVKLAVKDSPVIAEVFPAATLKGYWRAFLDEINGTPDAYFHTGHVLDVSEWSLNIQAAARA